MIIPENIHQTWKTKNISDKLKKIKRIIFMISLENSPIFKELCEELKNEISYW